MANARRPITRIDVRVSGEEVVARRLRDLPKKLVRKYVKAAYSRGATVLLKEARRRVPEKTGNLKKALIRKIRVNNTQHYALVGPDHSIAPHQHLVEFGTAKRQRSSGGSTGASPPRPFLRPALENKKREIARLIIRHLIGGLRREANVQR